MKCPKCSSELVKGEERVFQTLSEHVSYHNNYDLPKRTTWVCSCMYFDGYWDDYGDYYGEYPKEYIGPVSAIGSPAMKIEMEVYKPGLKKKTYLSPYLTFGIWQPYVEHNYVFNEDGEMLSRSWSLNFLKKGDVGHGYCLHVSLWYSTWWFLWRTAKRNKRRPERFFELSINRAFPYRAFETFLKVRFLRKYLKYRKTNGKQKRFLYT